MAPRRSARTQQAVAPPSKEDIETSVRGDLTFLASPTPAKKTKGIAKKANVPAPRRSIGSTPVKVPSRVARPKPKRKQVASEDAPKEKPSSQTGSSDTMDVVIDSEPLEASEPSEPAEEPTATKKRPRSVKPKQPTKAASEKKQRPTPLKKMPPDTVDIRSPVLEAPEPPASNDSMDFTDLKVTQVINESSQFKTLTLLGIYHSQPAIVLLEKTLFDEAVARRALIDQATKATLDFTNDIYSRYKIIPSNIAPALNSLNATVIWPASESVLAKYTRSEVVFFSETPDAYSKVVEPYIDEKFAQEKDYNNWLYNILDGKSEVDRVILNDPEQNSGFMLVHNLKSSCDDQDVNALAICHRRDIRSLRDLNDTHLILLKNILTKGTKAIKDKYKKSKGQLRPFIHYQPSYYHFHVHFRIVDAGEYQTSDRDNLLSTVINNITLNKDYYKKSTLTYPLAQSTPLYKALKLAKRV